MNTFKQLNTIIASGKKNNTSLENVELDLIDINLNTGDTVVNIATANTHLQEVENNTLSVLAKIDTLNTKVSEIEVLADIMNTSIANNEVYPDEINERLGLLVADVDLIKVRLADRRYQQVHWLRDFNNDSKDLNVDWDQATEKFAYYANETGSEQFINRITIQFLDGTAGINNVDLFNETYNGSFGVQFSIRDYTGGTMGDLINIFFNNSGSQTGYIDSDRKWLEIGMDYEEINIGTYTVHKFIYDCRSPVLLNDDEALRCWFSDTDFSGLFDLKVTVDISSVVGLVPP